MSHNNENLYKIIFFKNNIKTITMEKFSETEEEAIKFCIEKTTKLNLSDLYDRYEVEQLKIKKLWE